MKQKIAITALTSISPLGTTPDVIWNQYLSDKTLIASQEFNNQFQFVARIPSNLRKEIEALRLTDIKYKGLDETVLMAILVSRQAIKKAKWKEGVSFGVNIGSSRGATQLFENTIKSFLKQARLRLCLHQQLH